MHYIDFQECQAPLLAKPETAYPGFLANLYKKRILGCGYPEPFLLSSIQFRVAQSPILGPSLEYLAFFLGSHSAPIPSAAAHPITADHLSFLGIKNHPMMHYFIQLKVTNRVLILYRFPDLL